MSKKDKTKSDLPHFDGKDRSTFKPCGWDNSGQFLAARPGGLRQIVRVSHLLK